MIGQVRWPVAARREPQDRSAINWAHPLARKLKYLWHFSLAARGPDASRCLLTGTAPSSSGAFSFMEADGRREFGNTTTASVFPVSIAAPLTLLVVYKRGSISSQNAGIAWSLGNEWTNIYEGGVSSPNDYVISVSADFGGGVTLTSGPAYIGPSTNSADSGDYKNFSAVALTTSGANDFRGSRSGGPIVADTSCGALPSVSNLYLGSGSSSTHVNNGATFKLVALLDASVSNDMLLLLSAEPWGLLVDERTTMYVPSAGTGGGTSVTTGLGALSITGYAPTITAPRAVTTGVGALTVTGLAPTVTVQQRVTAGLGALTVTGLAPTVSLSTAVATGVGALTVAGLAPTITAQTSVSTGVGALSITGQAPTVQVTEQGTIVPGTGVLAITGHAPTVTQQITVSPAVAALALTGLAPTLQVVSDTTVTTGLGALTIAGYAPTAEVLLNVLPGTGQIVITGHAPTVEGGTASVVPSNQGAGRSKRGRKGRKYLVEVDGQEFFVSSVEEAKEFLQKAEEVAVEKAEQQIERSAKTVKSKRKAVQDARKALKLPDIRVVDAETDETAAAIEAQLRQTMDRIRQQYEQAIQAVEIGAYLRRKQEEEEDAIVTLLMHL